MNIFSYRTIRGRRPAAAGTVTTLTPLIGSTTTGSITTGSDDDRGQATAEYALVMLAAAGLAGLVLAWAVGTDAVGRLMDAVLDAIISDVTE